MPRGQMRDKARLVRRTKVQSGAPPTSVRVEGGFVRTKPVTAPADEVWFRCHYDPGSEGEVRGPGSVRRRRAGAHLVTDRRALDGSEIALKASDQLEVNSVAFGTLLLDVVGTPEKLTTGRVSFGWIVDLAKTKRESPG